MVADVSEHKDDLEGTCCLAFFCIQLVLCKHDIFYLPVYVLEIQSQCATPGEKLQLLRKQLAGKMRKKREVERQKRQVRNLEQI